MRSIGASLFTLPELEIAAGLPTRTLELLKKEGLLGDPHNSKGWPRWSLKTLAGLALGGAIFRLNSSLILSMRLGIEIVDEFSSLKGKIPSLLDCYREVWSDAASQLTSPDDVQMACHHALRDRPNLYVVGSARQDDLRYAIIDRRYVLEISSLFNSYSSPFGNGNTPGSLSYIINGWEHSGRLKQNINIQSQQEIFGEYWESEENKRLAKKLESEALDAWKNSESVFAVNVSLAIRNALDRIYDHREGK